MNNDSLKSSTVVKCFRVLQVIADNSQKKHQANLTLTRISEMLGFNIATTSRYCAALEDYGLVQRNADQSYTLGFKVVELYHAFAGSDDIRRVARPIMKELSSETQETIYLGVLRGTKVFYLDRIETTLALRPHTQIGESNSLYCTGLGKAILGFSAASLFEAVVEEGLTRRTEQTIIDRDALYRELQSIQAAGYAVDNMENEEHIKCVAAPIYDSSRRAIAALSLSGPFFRFDNSRIRDELGPKVIRACQTISKRLGYVSEKGTARYANDPKSH